MNPGSVFAGVCAFFSAALVGLWVKRKLFRKAAFYADYYEYLVFANEKISYERMPIGELNARFFEKKKGEFISFLKGEKTEPPIKESEISEITRYLAGIGMTDADTQIASLNAKCAELKRFNEKEGVKYRKDGSLYFKLSVLVGIAAFVLLV